MRARILYAAALTLGLWVGGCMGTSVVQRSSPPITVPAHTPPAAAEDIVVRTNAERARLGLRPFTRNAALMLAAQIQADQMAAANRIAHDLPEGA